MSRPKITNEQEALAAIRQDDLTVNGDALRYVPKELRTREVCLEAVKQDGDALEYVPEELREEVYRKFKSEK